MELVEVELSGLRHFADGSVLKVRPDLTMLVGPNGSGKSTILDAVQFLLEGRVPPDLVESNGSRPVQVKGVFANDVSTLLARATLDSRGRRTLEISVRVAKALPSGVETATVKELRSFLGDAAPKGAQKPELQELATTRIEALDDSDFVETWVAAASDVEQRLPRLTRLDAEAMTDAKKAIDEVLAREFRQYMEKNKTEWLKFNRGFVEHAAEAVRAISGKVHDQCGDIMEAFLVSPSVNTDRMRVDAELTAVRSGEPIAAEGLSLGQRRRLALAVSDALTERLGKDGTDLLAYDEPDTHLDNSSQRRLLRILNQQAALAGVQVMAATHSTRLIDDCAATSLVHLDLDPEGVPDVRVFAELVTREEEVDLMADLDASLDNSRLLSDRLIVVCEGDSERDVLPKLYLKVFGRSLRSDGVTLVHKDGGSDALRFAAMLQRLRPDSVLLLLDSDQTAKAENYLRGTRLTTCFVGDDELEDCLTNEVWLLAIREAASELGVPVRCDVDVIESFRGKSTAFSKAMKKWLWDNDLELSKVDLARRAAELSEPTDIHESLAIALNEIERMARAGG